MLGSKKIGNTSYNLDVIKDLSLTAFKKAYAGKINTDCKETFEALNDEIKDRKKALKEERKASKEESVEETPESTEE